MKPKKTKTTLRKAKSGNLYTKESSCYLKLASQMPAAKEKNLHQESQRSEDESSLSLIQGNLAFSAGESYRQQSDGNTVEEVEAAVEIGSLLNRNSSEVREEETGRIQKQATRSSFSESSVENPEIEESQTVISRKGKFCLKFRKKKNVFNYGKLNHTKGKDRKVQSTRHEIKPSNTQTKAMEYIQALNDTNKKREAAE